MNHLQKLHKLLEQYNLLNHPFYKAWSNGELSINILQLYAQEYYGHVAAFPRYISTIHSLCDNIDDRQVLLTNLMDEELGEENHPELWLRFAEGVGCNREDCKTQTLSSTKKLIDGYFDITRENFASGLGALYAYERQTPPVSQSKIEGLKSHYNITNPQTLKFFEVHMEADEWHTEECAKLLNALDAQDQNNATEGALKGAKLLWGFLDEIHQIHIMQDRA